MKILFFFFFVLFSCKTKKESPKFQLNQESSSLELAHQDLGENISIPIIKMKDPSQNYYIELCDEEKKCTSDLTSLKDYPILGLFPDKKYIVQVYTCSSDHGSYSCNHLLDSLEITQKSFNDPYIHNSLKEIDKISKNQKLASYIIYGLIKKHKEQIALCPIQSSEIKNYINDLDFFLKENPIEIINHLSQIFSEQSTFYVSKKNEGLSLTTDPSEKNIKVTFINYKLEPKKELKIFKEGRWDADFESIGAYFEPNSNGHSAFLIERRDPKTGAWTTAYHVSWPSGDKVDEILNDSYNFRNITRIEMPPLSESDFLRFRDWYRSSEYAPLEGDAKNLADQRLAIKKSIRIDKIREFGIEKNSDPKGKKIIEDALERRKKIKELESAQDEKNKQKIQKLKNEDAFWFKDWKPYQTWAKDKEEEDVEKMKESMNKLLNNFESVKKLSEWAPGEKEEILEKKNISEYSIKKILFLPDSFDLEKSAINFEGDLFGIASPREVFKNIHGFDPVTEEEKWDKFIFDHYENFQDFLRKDKTKHFQYKYGKEQFLIKRYKISFDEYQTFITPWVTYYTKQTKLLNKKAEAYGKSYDMKKNNCSCAVARSLEQLYQEKFTSTVMTRPGSVESKVKKFSEEYKKSLSVSPHDGSASKLVYATLGISTLATLASIATTSAVLINNNDQLSLSSENDSCLQKEKNIFYEKSEPYFEYLRESKDQKELFFYLLEQ